MVQVRLQGHHEVLLKLVLEEEMVRYGYVLLQLLQLLLLLLLLLLWLLLLLLFYSLKEKKILYIQVSETLVNQNPLVTSRP